MKMGRVLSLALAGSVAVAPSARAVPTAGETVDYCLQYLSFTACASAAITVSGNTLTAVVTNTSNTMGNVPVGKLTAFGFFYLPAVVDGGTVTLTGDTHADDWVDGVGDLANPLQSSQGGNWLGGASGATGNDFIGPGVSGTFTFSITPGANLDWSKVGFGWRGQGIDEQEFGFGSIKCYGYEGAVSEPGGICEPPTVVPEPATMALLATGLVGMGGATLLRRRRQKQDA